MSSSNGKYFLCLSCCKVTKYGKLDNIPHTALGPVVNYLQIDGMKHDFGETKINMNSQEV